MYIFFYLSYTGGGSAGPQLDEIDDIVADILGKANVTLVGIGNAQEILDFVHEAVEQPPRYGVLFNFPFPNSRSLIATTLVILVFTQPLPVEFPCVKDVLHDPDIKETLRL